MKLVTRTDCLECPEDKGCIICDDKLYIEHPINMQELLTVASESVRPSCKICRYNDVTNTDMMDDSDDCAHKEIRDYQGLCEGYIFYLTLDDNTVITLVEDED